MALALEDQRLIQAAVDFANLENVAEAARKMINLFEPVQRLPGGQQFSDYEEFAGDILGVRSATFKPAQDELIGWLDRIIKYKRLSAKKKRELENKVAERLGEIETEGKISFTEGEIKQELSYRLNSYKTIYAYAIALLLDERNGLLKRVGKCRKCGKYFVDFRKGRGAPQNQYCSRKHRNAHRQERHRERERKKSSSKA